MIVKSLHTLYFEQLRDLYNAEQQLIKMLPKMVTSASSRELRNALAGYLEKTRKRARRIEAIFERMARAKNGKTVENLAREGKEASKGNTENRAKDISFTSFAPHVEHNEIADMVAAELRNALVDHLEKTRKHAERLEAVFEQMGEWARGKKSKGMILQGNGSLEITAEKTDNGARDAALIAAARRVEHYEIAGYGCVLTYATILGDAHAAGLLAQSLEEEKESGKALQGIAERLNLEVNKQHGKLEEQTASPLTTPSGHSVLSQLQY
jgi:ferritin-like metal-binding protein YciE